MEHLVIVVITLVICIASLVFFTPCHSLQLASDHGHQPTHPRRLKLNEHQSSVKKNYIESAQNMVTYNSKNDAFIDGNAQNKEAKSTSSSSLRTWREWVEEGGDTSQYFTMDYSHVRRRRPIHNKSLPVTP